MHKMNILGISFPKFRRRQRTFFNFQQRREAFINTDTRRFKIQTSDMALLNPRTPPPPTTSDGPKNSVTTEIK